MRDWAHSRRLGTPADEAGYVVLRQPPASKLANLFRIDVRDHALGLVTQQLGRRVTEHPPGGWLGPRTPSLREGPGSASVPSGSPDPVAGTGAPARPCGRGKLAQFSLLQRFAVWWVAAPRPILPVPAVLLALCRLVVNYVCRDRADLLWQYADCARLVDESGKKGWPKLDDPQRG